MAIWAISASGFIPKAHLEFQARGGRFHSAALTQRCRRAPSKQPIWLLTPFFSARPSPLPSSAQRFIAQSFSGKPQAAVFQTEICHCTTRSSRRKTSPMKSVPLTLRLPSGNLSSTAPSATVALPLHPWTSHQPQAGAIHAGVDRGKPRIFSLFQRSLIWGGTRARPSLAAPRFWFDPPPRTGKNSSSKWAKICTCSPARSSDKRFI